jgi:hypothetical protein
MPFCTEGQATSENLLQLTRLPVFTSNFLASDPPYVFLLCMLFFPNAAKVFATRASVASSSELELGSFNRLLVSLNSCLRGELSL